LGSADWLPDHKFSPAAFVDPDAATIRSPGASLDAGGPAALLGQLNAASGVCTAVVAPTVVGCAVNCLAATVSIAAAIPVVTAAVSIAAAIPVIVVAVSAPGDEFSPAASVDPDAAIVISPGASLDAGGSAALLGHLNTPTGVGIAVVAVPIVGCAVDGLAMCCGGLYEDCAGYQGKEKKGQKSNLGNHERLSIESVEYVFTSTAD
jgi:hypothetical protein